MDSEPVLTTSVEPAMIWRFATHLTDVVTVQTMHGDVGALPATRSVVVGSHAGSESRRGRVRWWYGLHTSEHRFGSSHSERVEGV